MIELSLEKINAQSPYEVSYAPNGDFVFATNLGIHYLISLLETIIADFKSTAQALTAGKP